MCTGLIENGQNFIMFILTISIAKYECLDKFNTTDLRVKNVKLYIWMVFIIQC